MCVCVCVYSVFVVLVAYCAYINVWRYVVVHVRVYFVSVHLLTKEKGK